MSFQDYRKLSILLVLCLLLVIIGGCIRQDKKQGAAAPVSAGADDTRKFEQLNRLADDIYKGTSDGGSADVRLKLEEMSKLIPKIHYGGTASLEAMNALSDAVIQAKRAFNSVNAAPQQTLLAAARLRLITDALTHPNEPMWRQYYKVMKNDVHAFEQAIKDQNASNTTQKLGAYEQHYQTIRAALFVSKEPSDVEKMDSLLAFLKAQTNVKAMSFKNLAGGAQQLQDALDILFGENEERSAYLPLGKTGNPIIWILLMAAIIVPVLGFAGWRMHGDNGYVKIGGKGRDGFPY